MPLDFTMHINVKEQRSGFDGTCKQMHLRISDLECRNATGREVIDCPVSKTTDGLRMFGYVAVNY